LRLSVVQGNEAAERLYRRCGFATTGQEPELMPDGVRREYVLEKLLHR
jgi:ribosomal protein S18 acetylase RimI-like enzyme